MEGKRVEMYYCHSVFSRKSKFGDLNCNSVLETAKTKERKKERKNKNRNLLKEKTARAETNW